MIIFIHSVFVGDVRNVLTNDFDFALCKNKHCNSIQDGDYNATNLTSNIYHRNENESDISIGKSVTYLYMFCTL